MPKRRGTPSPRPPRKPPAEAPPSSPLRLEICLLGRFETRLGSTSVPGLESAAARALLTFLVCQPERKHPRDIVASVLWPEVDEPTARHNLRQTLYNLRSSLRQQGIEVEPIATSHQAVYFDPASAWVDVLALRDALKRAHRADGSLADPSQLARAAHLYQGDLLAGFYLRGNPAFEEWLLAEQGRLRDEVSTALRQLVAHHLQLGNYPLGMQYVRQLLRIDPYLEDAHRDLMRLYAFSGRRSRALAHYQELSRSLERELGVAPADQTQALARELEASELATRVVPEIESSTVPQVPFVEREDELAQLEQAWSAVQRGTFRLTLVEGTAGSGKTRLVRTFLDRAASSTRATVLLGNAFDLSPPLALGPFGPSLSNTLATDMDVANRILVALGTRNLTTIAPLVPEVAELEPRLLARQGEPTGDLASAVAALLAALADRGNSQRALAPVILFLDDLQCADAATLDLLGELARQLAHQPCWIVATVRPAEELDAEHPLQPRNLPSALRRCQRVRVPPLTEAGLHSLAGHLVGQAGADLLGRFLADRSEGRPLLAIELINALADGQSLVRQADGQWALTATREQLEAFAPRSLEAVLRHRLRCLPPSARRLLTLAAILGPSVEPGLLQEAEEEHGEVVEIALRLLMERWLLRPFPRYWGDSRRAREQALGIGGARAATLEFTHTSLRRLLYEQLPAERREALHLRVAEVLERERHAEGPGAAEALSYHFHLGGAPAKARAHALRASQRARLLGATEVARYYAELATDPSPGSGQ
jgi:DNA-binding SARP family transcriptional activator